MSWRRLKCFDRHERDRSNFDGFLPFISLSMPFNQSNTKPLVFFAQFARCIYNWNENGEINGANAIVIESNRPQTKQKLICTLNKSEHEALNNRQTGWKRALKALHAHTVCEMCIVYVRTRSSEAPAKHTDLLNERHLHFFSLLKFAFVAFFFIVFQLMLLLGFFPLTSSKHRLSRSAQEDIANYYLQIEWLC